MDRITSFSIPPTDKQAKKEVEKLKEHCKKTGTNFSFLMIKAVKLMNKELGL